MELPDLKICVPTPKLPGLDLQSVRIYQKCKISPLESAMGSSSHSSTFTDPERTPDAEITCTIDWNSG